MASAGCRKGPDRGRLVKFALTVVTGETIGRPPEPDSAGQMPGCDLPPVKLQLPISALLYNQTAKPAGAIIWLRHVHPRGRRRSGGRRPFGACDRAGAAPALPW